MTNPITRRKFLISTAISSVSLITYPKVVLPAENIDIKYIMRLHPVRFFAGLIFDIFKSVFVELAKDAIVSSLYNGRRPKEVKLGYSYGTESTSEFQHPNYKASTIILGVSDYESHKERKLKILLNNQEHKNKFENIILYLKDEKIRIKTTHTEYSQSIGNDIEPDDLFLIDYFQSPLNAENHYRNLIDITESSIFKSWSA